MTRTASAALTGFVGRHEGFVSKAYRDPGGVITIGYGFTDLSRAFAAYWRKTRGRALAMGDTIGRAEADAVLARLIGEEYAPPVATRFGDVMQHRFDAACDVAYNAGFRALQWKWAAALAANDVASAAGLLRVTAVTAGGRKLAGLIRRRDDEANLLTSGNYGGARTAEVQSSAEVKAFQSDLAALGLYPGPVDGDAGSSRAAVVGFQKAHGLVADGIVGPATRAAIRRALDARAARGAIGGGAGAGAVVGLGEDVASRAPPATTPLHEPAAFDWQTVAHTIEWALVAVVLVATATLVWRHRGLILKRRTPA